MRNIQFVKWPLKDFHIAFIKGHPLRQPAAFHLIYKWSLWLGNIEIRRFLTDNEREDAVIKYINNQS